MLGVMPFNVARHYVASGTVSVLDIELPPPSGPVGTITRAGPLTNPVLEPLLDAVRKVALRMAR